MVTYVDDRSLARTLSRLGNGATGEENALQWAALISLLKGLEKSFFEAQGRRLRIAGDPMPSVFGIWIILLDQ